MNPLLIDSVIKCAANFTFRRTLVAMTGDAMKVVDASKERLGVAFVNSSGQVTVDTVSSVTNGIGFDVSAAETHALMIGQDWLPLAQADWYAIGSIGTPLVIFELFAQR